jgi:hypothetical protein
VAKAIFEPSGDQSELPAHPELMVSLLWSVPSIAIV